MSEKPVVRIKNWVVGHTNQLHGDVLDHPRFPPDTFVTTSKILSREDDVVETMNTIYKLIGSGLKKL